jgi:hypothetical protein
MISTISVERCAVAGPWAASGEGRTARIKNGTIAAKFLKILTIIDSKPGRLRDKQSAISIQARMHP